MEFCLFIKELAFTKIENQNQEWPMSFFAKLGNQRETPAKTATLNKNLEKQTQLYPQLASACT